MASLGETLTARKRAGKGSLLAYLMAGTVPPERYLEAVDRLRASGVTGIEVGFPFSDPIAEGPVIQRAASESLRLGFRWEALMSILPQVSSRVPTAVMTYLNIFHHRGVPAALEDLSRGGATAVIIPDLPVEEVGPFRSAGKRSHVDPVLLASPGSAHGRVEQIARGTRGFLYVVSRYGTTGVVNDKAIDPARSSPELSGILTGARKVRPRLPLLVGFGVSHPEDVRRYRGMGADGVIVGSAFQSLLTEENGPVRLADMASDLVNALEAPHG